MHPALRQGFVLIIYWAEGTWPDLHVEKITLTIVWEWARVGHGEARTLREARTAIIHERRPWRTGAVVAMRWSKLVTVIIHERRPWQQRGGESWSNLQHTFEGRASKGRQVGGRSTGWCPLRSPGRKEFPPGGRDWPRSILLWRWGRCRLKLMAGFSKVAGVSVGHMPFPWRGRDVLKPNSKRFERERGAGKSY